MSVRVMTAELARLAWRLRVLTAELDAETDAWMERSAREGVGPEDRRRREHLAAALGDAIDEIERLTDDHLRATLGDEGEGR